MASKRTLIILAVAVLALGIGGALLNRSNKPKLSFTESSLQTLENKIRGLDVEDLEGLSSTSTVPFSTQDLDTLGSRIDNLSFEDLEGLSSP
jgi:uncharacterized protein YoxC